VDSKKHSQDEIVFSPKQKIIYYEGEHSTNAQIEETYGEYTAPHAMTVGKNTNLYSGLLSGIASYANSKRTLSQSNAKITDSTL
jgi:hypothetical protein